MNTRNINLAFKKKNIKLYIISDIHLGSPACALDKFKARVKRIASEKDAYVLVNGDVCDFIRFNDPRFTMSEIKPEYSDIDLQYEAIKEILMPLKGKILAFGMGNHEFTVKKYYGFDITRMLARDFNVPYYEDVALLSLKVNKHTFRVLATHGATHSNQLSGAHNWLKRVANDMGVAPDITTMGHVHRLDTLVTTKFDEKFGSRNTYFAISGTYYDTYSSPESNYGTRKVFSPLPVGCVMFELFDNGKIIDYKILEN